MSTLKTLVDYAKANQTSCPMARPGLEQETTVPQKCSSGPHLDSSPEALRREVEEELVRWTPVIKAIGLKLE